MADFMGSYLTCTAEDEVTATPRTLKAIIEAELGVTLDRDLAVAITIQNHSGGDIKISHLADPTTHYLLIAAGTTRQIVSGVRQPLSSIYVKVATDSDDFSVEVVFE